jgi:hypothetical protein
MTEETITITVATARVDWARQGTQYRLQRPRPHARTGSTRNTDTAPVNGFSGIAVSIDDRTTSGISALRHESRIRG